ncbi:hypothetical protein ECEC1736_2238, partial [Escherichia coli EC1736]|jgi:hypothetical protein
MAV